MTTVKAGGTMDLPEVLCGVSVFNTSSSDSGSCQILFSGQEQEMNLDPGATQETSSDGGQGAYLQNNGTTTLEVTILE